MIEVLNTLFDQAGVNVIEQICRFPGDAVKCPQIVP